MKSIKKIQIVLLFGIISLFIGCTGAKPPEKQALNIIIILTDDQRYDTMEAMPYTKSVIFDQGITFDKAYVTTSRCCPSRSSILTGMYAHNHNVRVNSDKLMEKTMFSFLHDEGYYTGLVGKYLNSYPKEGPEPPLPEFDLWAALVSGPDTAAYNDPMMNVNGTWEKQSGYQTYVLRDFALEFIQTSIDNDQPFALLFSTYAPHLPAKAAIEHKDLFKELPLHRPPNYNPESMPGKPEWLQSIEPMDAWWQGKIDKDRSKQLQTLMAVDESIRAIMQLVEDNGQLDNTMVIFLSDNGMFWGEHRLYTSKIYVYEESTNIPMAIYYPPLIKEGFHEKGLTANIDIAPTIYDFVGLPIPEKVDGLSLRPLLEKDETFEWREHLLIEGWPVNAGFTGNTPPFQAIHSGQYVYVETGNDLSEFYNLELDPFQLNNEINNPKYADIIQQMQATLEEERKSIKPAPPSSGAYGIEMPE